MLDALYLHLSTRGTLSDGDTSLIAEMLTGRREFRKGDDLVPEGSRPTVSTVLLDGFAARYRVMKDGSRQFTAFHVPGDFVDLHAFLLGRMDNGVLALSPCTVAVMDHATLKRITDAHPHLTRLFWLDTVLDSAIQSEWIVSLGRRGKVAHLAPFLCELFTRLKVVHRTDGMKFRLPLTQVELADGLGLSIVHMNRVMMSLRRSWAIHWTNHTVTIKLIEIADFDSGYMSLVRCASELRPIHKAAEPGVGAFPI